MKIVDKSKAVPTPEDLKESAALDRILELEKSWYPDPARLAREDVQAAMKKAQELLGYPGVMISASKSWFTKKYPKKIPVFNSNLVCKDLGKIWYGDLDVTEFESKLQELAKVLGHDIYVLRERAARFEYENNPQIDEAVLIVRASGETEVSPFLGNVTRGTRGKYSKKLIFNV